MLWLRSLFVLVVSLALLPTTVAACMVDNELSLEGVKYADVIFIGKAIDYKVSDDHFATISFTISETVFGENTTTRKVVWQNSTFGFPESWEFNGDVIVAGFYPNRSIREGYWYGGDLNLQPSSLHVLQRACSKPFLLEATEQNVRLVNAELTNQ